MAKPWEIADLDYVLDWLAEFTTEDFNRAARSGKVAFLGRLMNLAPKELILLARHRRKLIHLGLTKLHSDEFGASLREKMKKQWEAGRHDE